MSTLRSPDELQEDALNPNDPAVYTDPLKFNLLDPRQKMLASINMAKTGQMVDGDQIRTMEAILAGAGYTVNMDGVFSGEEMAAMKHFKERLEDKAFKETALTLLTTIAGVAAMDTLVPSAIKERDNALQQLSNLLPRPAAFAPEV